MIIGVIGKSPADISNFVHRTYDLRSFIESRLEYILVNGTIIKGILKHEDLAGNVYDQIIMTPAYTSLYDYAMTRLRGK